VPSIVGLSVACTIAAERVAKDKIDVEMLRNNFEIAITTALPEARVNGAGAHRLPGSCSLTVPGIPASMVIANLARIALARDRLARPVLLILPTCLLQWGFHVRMQIALCASALDGKTQVRIPLMPHE